MKKFLFLTVVGLMLLGSSTSVFAGTHVSEMAISKGGVHVARCAKTMSKGVSACLNLPECQNEM